MRRRFRQIDVFESGPLTGNPLAVVLDSEGLDTEAMQRFASWMNLSETTFLVPPQDLAADYAVRIFTTEDELPFAGHPTLGTCHAWLEAGGVPADDGIVVQECGVGLVPIWRGAANTLSFGAPAVRRSGPVSPEDLERATTMLGLDPAQVVDAAWADNGPGWLAILLADVDQLLALRPTAGDLDVGVVAPYPPGSPLAFELRAFYPKDGILAEDPVTGSLNASVAQWLIATGRARPPYVAGQGTALGRAGRVRIDVDSAGGVWVGGSAVTRIAGTLALG
jgi:PhzF family phenazine biosynthesis protein